MKRSVNAANLARWLWNTCLLLHLPNVFFNPFSSEKYRKMLTCMQYYPYNHGSTAVMMLENFDE
jgi:hypothetical protein